MKTTVSLPLVLTTLLAAGCAGDEEPIELERDKPLSEITLDETDVICDEASGLFTFEDKFLLSCHYQAEEENVGQCQEFVSSCMEEFEGWTVSSRCEWEEDELSRLPECAADVTVGEWDACMHAAAKALSDSADNASCDAPPQPISELPAACETVTAKCPDLIWVIDI